MKYCFQLVLFALFLPQLHGQVPPICDSPANGSAWRLIGPNSLPELGPKARSTMTGTGAQMRIQFLDGGQPNPKILYAATPTGGLFRTMDATAQMPVWENVTDSTRLPVFGVRGFALLPGNPETIYIGTGIRYPLDMRRNYGIGVLRSEDGAQTWQRTGISFTPPKGKKEKICHDLLIDPGLPQIVHAVCGPDYYRSDDGGENFSKKKTLPHAGPAGWSKSFRDILAKPDDPRTLYLSSDGNFFYRSADGGETWTETDVRELGVTDETVRMDVVVSPLDPDLVYLACRQKKKGELLLRSLDAGLTWEVVFEKKLRTSFEKHSIAVSPHDVNVLYFGGLYIDRVELGGEKPKSRTVSRGIHMDHRDLLAVSDGQGGDIVYSANDGGLYRGTVTEDKWEWVDISGTGMNNTQFYGIAVSEDFSVVMGGTQDNGMLVGDRAGNFFKPNIGGDAVDAAIDPYDQQVAYGTTWALRPPTVHRSTDGGQTFGRAINAGFSGKADTYYFPMQMHEDGSLYASKEKVFRLPPGSDTWEPVGDIDLPINMPFKVTAMCVAPSDPNFIYAYGDRLYRTSNAAADSVAWTDVGTNLGRVAQADKGGGVTMAVEVHAHDPLKVWVSFSVFDSPHKVYFSADGGATWANVSEGLPDWPVNALAFQAGTGGALYAGTEVGVFYNPDATNPASEWRCFNNGLPVCIIIDLEVNYCAGAVVAGTHGRGIWESPFASPSVFPTEEVTKNTTWERRILRADLVVRNGATLTLTNEVRVAAGKKISVERGGTLVLDGARVKSLCSEPWLGVELEEDLNFFQRFFGGPPGRMELKNGAVVE